MSSQNLVGRVAIVTGATSCVGGCTTRRLINMGMIVVGVSRKLPGTKRAGWGRFSQNVQRGFSRLVPRQKDDIVPSQEGQLGKVFFVRGDVTNPKDIRRIIKWTRKKFGHIDVLVNAAGSVQNYDFLYSDQKMLKEMIETRMLGTLLFSRAVILEMKAMKIENGHIIATSGIIGKRDLAVYSGMYLNVQGCVTIMTSAIKDDLENKHIPIKVTDITIPRELVDDSPAEGVEEGYITAADIAQEICDAISQHACSQSNPSNN